VREDRVRGSRNPGGPQLFPFFFFFGALGFCGEGQTKEDIEKRRRRCGAPPFLFLLLVPCRCFWCGAASGWSPPEVAGKSAYEPRAAALRPFFPPPFFPSPLLFPPFFILFLFSYREGGARRGRWRRPADGNGKKRTDDGRTPKCLPPLPLFLFFSLRGSLFSAWSR